MRKDPHGGQPLPHNEGGPNAVKFEINTVFIALRCWWKFAAPAAILLAAAAGSLVYYQFEPTYSASRWMEIREKADNLITTRTDESQRFVANQIELIRSPYLLRPLMTQPEIRSTPELAKERDPYAALIKRLWIKHQGQSDLYVVEFTSKSPQKAALIVNSVVDAYLALYKANESERRTQREQALAEFKKQLAMKLDAVTQTANDHAKSLDVAIKDPLLDQSPTASRDPEAEALAMVQSELIRVEVDCKLAEADYKAVETSLQSGPAEIPEAELVSLLARDEELGQLEGALLATQEALTRFRKTGTEASLARHPVYNGHLKTEKELTEKLAKRREERREEIKKEYTTAVETARKSEFASLKQTLAEMTLRRDQLRTSYNEQLKKQRGARTDTLQLRLTLGDLDLAQKLHTEVNNELEAFRLNGQMAVDRAKALGVADVPALPVEDIPYRNIALFAGAAFCIPFLLAIGWEHLFRRVNSRQQLETNGALKVVGEITSLPRRTRRGAGTKVTRDLQLFEESVDGLRTYLSLVDTLQGLRVLAVTSAISREGKTSVAAQLAVSIAAATGEPTLLIDADLRSPDVHRVFGVDLSPGLADVLSGDLTDDEAIETDFNQTLHLMTAGKLGSSPHRLLGSGEFRALLERLRGTYRYIVIDTPPLLPASEALILARAADAAILSARRDYSRLDQVTEAYTRLRAAGVSFAGVVLNGIPTRHYAYKYGSYSYREQLTAHD